MSEKHNKYDKVSNLKEHFSSEILGEKITKKLWQLLNISINESINNIHKVESLSNKIYDGIKEHEYYKALEKINYGQANVLRKQIAQVIVHKLSDLHMLSIHKKDRYKFCKVEFKNSMRQLQDLNQITIYRILNIEYRHAGYAIA